MVRSHPQHQRSSSIGCFFKFSARTLMDEPAPLAASAGAAASPAAAEHERDGGELQAEPSAALASQPPAGGPASASAEAIVEPPPGVERTGREPTARPRRSAVTDPGKDLLDEITALKEEQKKAKEKKLAITKDLRNANRRRQRLKKRAKALSDADLLAVISLRNHAKALGRQTSAEEEEDDEDSESELDEQTGTGSAPSDGPSPARPKKKAKQG